MPYFAHKLLWSVNGVGPVGWQGGASLFDIGFRMLRSDSTDEKDLLRKGCVTTNLPVFATFRLHELLMALVKNPAVEMVGPVKTGLASRKKCATSEKSFRVGNSSRTSDCADTDRFSFDLVFEISRFKALRDWKRSKVVNEKVSEAVAILVLLGIVAYVSPVPLESVISVDWVFADCHDKAFCCF
jgi:hypothetical protein